MDFDTKDEGASVSERFVFPDGVPLPLSRIAQAMERTGLVVRHVEGLPEDYAQTLTLLDRESTSRATTKRCVSPARSEYYARAARSLDVASRIILEIARLYFHPRDQALLGQEADAHHAGGSRARA